MNNKTKHKLPKHLLFANCPFCGEPCGMGFKHKLRVIRLFSNGRKGKYVVWCKNEPFKLHTIFTV